MTSSDRIIEMLTPPMTAMARGCRISAPEPMAKARIAPVNEEIFKAVPVRNSARNLYVHVLHFLQSLCLVDRKPPECEAYGRGSQVGCRQERPYRPVENRPIIYVQIGSRKIIGLHERRRWATASGTSLMRRLSISANAAVLLSART